MRDYSKQNKAIFLSDGRCVFEEDAPKFEEHLRKKDKLIASTEIPRGIRGKLDLIEKFDESVHPSKIYSNAWAEYIDYTGHQPKEKQRKNCNTCSISGEYASKCPANNINDIKYNATNDWWNVCFKLFFSAGFSNEADNCPGWKEKK